MELSSLTAISPVDGRYAARSEALRPVLSEFGLIRYRVEVEVRWFQALAENPDFTALPPLDAEAGAILERLVGDFDENAAARIKAIEATTKHDVKAVEYFLKERFEEAPGLRDHSEFLHFACTSEDINNLAYALMLREARVAFLLPAHKALDRALVDLATRHAETPMLSRTHGQAASPTTLGKELVNVIERLRRQSRRLEAVEILGKFNGAVGNYNAHLIAFPQLDWPQFSRRFVESMELGWNPWTTQIEPHDWMAEYFHALFRCHTILVDLCRDVWSYIAIGYFRQKPVADEVGSSTMPHKINPIDFENAEGNLGVSNALLEHLAGKLPVSRWQRDLTDSTVLRTIGTALGHAVVAYEALQRGLSRLDVDHARLEADLAGAWEVLAEPIQTVMRLNGVDNPYEQLKALTRGQRITAETLSGFIAQLDIPDPARRALLDLNPSDYTGLAARMVRQWLAENE